MRCPQCHQSEFELTVLCPKCEFSGALVSLERLSNLNFLLTELDTWSTVSNFASQRAHYEKQRREVEVELGLRLPPPTVEEAARLRQERNCLNILQQKLLDWVRQGWISPIVSQSMLDEEIKPRLQGIEERLLDAPARPLRSDKALFISQIEQKRFFLETVEGLHQRGDMVEVAYELVATGLRLEIERLEIKAGLRQVPVPEAETKAEAQSTQTEDASPPTPAIAPAPERTPWSWDRFWETLLSERTLQAILFMGVALMFAAGVSLVVYNWDTFPPAVQVAFLGGFTGLFYGLGWYVREKMELEGSGIALTAVASLLVPLDFYAFYLSGGFPPERWTEVWIGTSVVCLAAYTLTTYSVQAPFFAYLVAGAATSLLSSSLSWFEVDITLWQAPLALLAFTLAVLGEVLLRVGDGASGRWGELGEWESEEMGEARDEAPAEHDKRASVAASGSGQDAPSQKPSLAATPWAVFALPFWRFSLMMIVPLLLLATSWGLLLSEERPFFLALALSWWIGGLLFSLATERYRLQMMTLAAVTAFPLAMWFTQRWYFEPRAISRGWYGLGWAALIPFYWAAAWWLKGRFWHSEDKFYDANRRLVLRVSGLLVALAALSSLLSTSAATAVHLLLALLMVAAAMLWQQPRLIWLMSLFLMSGSAAWQASRGAALAELALPWTLLSILHVITALALTQNATYRARIYRKFFSTLPSFTFLPFSTNPSSILSSFSTNPSSILYGAALILAGLALLPPLLLFDQSLLAYALGNFIGINGWLAYLIEGKDGKAIRTWLASWQREESSFSPLHSPTLFHWLAALSFVPWLWLNWTNGRSASAPLAFAYSLLAWGLLWLSLRLRQVRWQHGKPWQVAAHLSQVAAFVVGMNHYQQGWLAIVLLLGAAFYFASAKLLYHHPWLLPGAIIFPFGWLLTLNWFGVQGAPLYLAGTFVVLAYFLIPTVLFHYAWIKDSFAQLLYQVGLLIGALAFFNFGLPATATWWDMPDKLLWLSGGQIILALSAVLWCWISGRVLAGHLAAWLMIYGGGLLVKIYSSGSGRSATLAALLAVTYILTERGLYRLALTSPLTERGRDEARAQGLLSVVHSLARWLTDLPQKRAIVRKAWRLFRKPLLVTGWIVSLGAIGAALVRNLLLLGGGATRQLWAIVALLILTGLYALSAGLFRKPRFVWAASGLAVISWTVMTHFVWWHSFEWNYPISYGVSWMSLALLAVAVSTMLAYRMGERFTEWNTPPLKVAHLLVPFALLWQVDHYTVSSITFGLTVLFYLAIVWMERRFEGVKQSNRGRFLYLATALMPIWAVYLLLAFEPYAALTTIGLLVLAFALPMLLLGKRLATWEASYEMPLYVTAYGSALMATLLVANERPFLIGVLFFNAGLTAFSAYFLRQPLWLYVVSITLPWAMILSLQETPLPFNRYGWALILLGGAYLLVARALRQRELAAYATPLMVSTWGLISLGLLPSSQDREGALVGYGLAAAISLISAIWLYQPLLANIAVGLAIVPYWMAVLELGVTADYYGLGLWPGILLALVLVARLSKRYELSYWWTFPLYAVGFGGLVLSALLSLPTGWQLPLALGLGTLVYGWAIYHFQQRRWLFLTGLWTQLTALALIDWLQLAKTPAEVAFYFTPMTILTAVVALLIEYRFNEGLPLLWGEEVMLRFSLKGWSRPLYGLLLLDLLIAQGATLISPSAGWVTLAHILIIGTLITLWRLWLLTYIPLGLGFIALLQRMSWNEALLTSYPVGMAWLALAYGTVGYGLRFWQSRQEGLSERVMIWQKPLERASWLISGISLGLTLYMGVSIINIIIRALFEQPFLLPTEVPRAQMVILVFAIIGLLHLMAAIVQRQRKIGYGALLLLLGSWSIWLLLIQRQSEVQYYALPAGAYLLGLGWLEWNYGSRSLAQWVDRAALLLLLGSVFWQSLGEGGGWYAVLMAIESLLIGWWGSSRRMRRFLYAGVTGVILAMIGQVIDPLFQLDTLVLMLLGGSLLALAVALERRLEEVRILSRDLRLALEQWD